MDSMSILTSKPSFTDLLKFQLSLQKLDATQLDIYQNIFYYKFMGRNGYSFNPTDRTLIKRGMLESFVYSFALISLFRYSQERIITSLKKLPFVTRALAVGALLLPAMLCSAPVLKVTEIVNYEEYNKRYPEIASKALEANEQK